MFSTKLISALLKSNGSGSASSIWLHCKDPPSPDNPLTLALLLCTTVCFLAEMMTLLTTGSTFHVFITASAMIQWDGSAGWIRSVTRRDASEGFAALARDNRSIIG